MQVSLVLKLAMRGTDLGVLRQLSFRYSSIKRRQLIVAAPSR